MNPYIHSDRIILSLRKKAMAVKPQYDSDKMEDQLRQRMYNLVRDYASEYRESDPETLKKLIDKNMAIVNEFWDRLNPLEVHSEEEWNSFLNDLTRKHGMMSPYYFKSLYNSLFSFSIPSKET